MNRNRFRISLLALLSLACADSRAQSPNPNWMTQLGPDPVFATTMKKYGGHDLLFISARFDSLPGTITAAR